MTPADGDRLRIGELAAVSGVPVRTIRYYHQQGVLPRPRMQGRVGWYGGDHLARLRQVRTLQDRGYSLAAVGDMIRSGVPGILFDAVPDGDPVAAVWPGGDIGVGQLRTVLGPAWDPALPDAMVALGLLEPHDDGGFGVPQPALLRAGLALVTRGVPLAVALTELTTLRTELAGIATRFAGIVERDVLFGTGTAPATSEQAGEFLDDVLPAVLVAVGRLLADAVRDAVLERLSERLPGRPLEAAGAQAG